MGELATGSVADRLFMKLETMTLAENKIGGLPQIVASLACMIAFTLLPPVLRSPGRICRGSTQDVVSAKHKILVQLATRSVFPLFGQR